MNECDLLLLAASKVTEKKTRTHFFDHYGVKLAYDKAINLPSDYSFFDTFYKVWINSFYYYLSVAVYNTVRKEVFDATEMGTGAFPHEKKHKEADKVALTKQNEFLALTKEMIRKIK